MRISDWSSDVCSSDLGRCMTNITAPMRRMRCAVYTRKSSEEGLDMEFNSLDAQRESCEAYIASQRAEGWVCMRERYDDGGYSGGSLERPGQIGRASCRDRVCQYVEISVVDVSLKKKERE